MNDTVYSVRNSSSTEPTRATTAPATPASLIERLLSKANYAGALTKMDVEEELLKDYKEYMSFTTSRPTIPAMPFILFKTHVTTYLDGVSKSVSILDFKSLLEEYTGINHTELPPMNLPFGCFAMNRTVDKLYLNCYYPEAKMLIKHENTRNVRTITEYEVPFPNVILCFQLSQDTSNAGGSKWKVDQVLYFCTPKKVSQLPDRKIIAAVNHDEGIFNLPVSNMYDNHTMCYGNNVMPMKLTNNLRGLDYYYQLLTIAPFNNDLGIRGLRSTPSVSEWYQYLSTLDEFPYENLRGNASAVDEPAGRVPLDDEDEGEGDVEDEGNGENERPI